MSKPIIAMGMAGFLFSDTPWKHASKKWFTRWAEELKDKGLLSWIEREDYFAGVEQIMHLRMPQASDAEKILIARKEYFDYVLEEKDAFVIREQAKKLLTEFENDATFAIITTTTQEVALQMLMQAGLQEKIPLIVGSKLSDKDNKLATFTQFLQEHGTPKIYIGCGREAVRTFCEQDNIVYLDYTTLKEEELLEKCKEALSR